MALSKKELELIADVISDLIADYDNKTYPEISNNLKSLNQQISKLNDDIKTILVLLAEKENSKKWMLNKHCNIY